MSAAALSVLLSVLLGAGLVAASHLVTVLVARATAGTDGPVAAPVLAATYVLKVLLLGWVLLTVPAPPWLAPRRPERSRRRISVNRLRAGWNKS